MAQSFLNPWANALITGQSVDDTERVLWSFALIALFGGVILLFHRRRVSRLGIMAPTLLAVAITIAVVMMLFDL